MEKISTSKQTLNQNPDKYNWRIMISVHIWRSVHIYLLQTNQILDLPLAMRKTFYAGSLCLKLAIKCYKVSCFWNNMTVWVCVCLFFMTAVRRILCLYYALVDFSEKPDLGRQLLHQCIWSHCQRDEDQEPATVSFVYDNGLLQLSGIVSNNGL